MWLTPPTITEHKCSQLISFWKKKKKAQTQLKSSESSNPLQYDSICLRLSDKELAKYREERERISRDRSVNSLCKKKRKGVIDTDFRSLGDFVEASSTVGTFNRRTRSGFLVLGCLAPHPPQFIQFGKLWMDPIGGSLSLAASFPVDSLLSRTKA